MIDSSLPGSDLVIKGIEDLSKGIESAEALLVSIGAPRLRSRAGIAVPPTVADPEARLYQLLSASDSDSAHSRYNALIRRLVSFERAAECGNPVDAARVREFMRVLGRRVGGEVRVYLTGGATAVLEGWRQTTADLDLKFVPDTDEVLGALPELKESLRMNMELASPADFIPELPGWQDRSLSIGREGSASFFHYDLYSQALAKLERGHAEDLLDVHEMLARGLVEAPKLLAFFEEIAPRLFRYPAIDPKSFRQAVEAIAASRKP